MVNNGGVLIYTESIKVQQILYKFVNYNNINWFK